MDSRHYYYSALLEEEQAAICQTASDRKYQMEHRTLIMKLNSANTLYRITRQDI